MLHRVFAAGLCSALLFATGAVGQTGSAFERINLSKATVGTATIEVWRLTILNPDCTEVPGGTLTILKQPAHGRVTLSTGNFYPSYPPANPRSLCNTRKAPGQQAYYQAHLGYAGADEFVLQAFTPMGAVREIYVDVVVRSTVVPSGDAR
jgi:hypothetical protein